MNFFLLLWICADMPPPAVRIPEPPPKASRWRETPKVFFGIKKPPRSKCKR